MLRLLPAALAVGLCLLGPGRGWAQSHFLGKPASAWAKLLDDAEPSKRRSAAFALGRIPSESQRYLAPLLQRAQTDDNPSVREMAAVSIGDVIVAQKDFGPVYWPEYGKALVERLEKESNPRVRRGLLYAVGAFGPDAAPALAVLEKALGDTNASVRQNAAWALGRVGAKVEGQAVIDDLCRLLQDDNTLVRRDAATALGAIAQALGEIAKPKPVGAVGPLLDLVERENQGDKGDPVVLKTALDALIRVVGERDLGQARRLHPLLGHEDPETGRFAAFVLANMARRQREEGPERPDGSEAVLKPAVPVLRTALKDDDPQIQEKAAAALGQLGPLAREAVPDLAEALVGRAKPVRINAAVALGRIGPAAEAAVSRLAEVFKDDSRPEDHQLRLYAAESLYWIGYPANTKALPTAIEFIRDPKAPGDIRQRGVQCLFGLDDLQKFGAEEALTNALRETAPETLMMRYDAARALANRLQEKAPDLAVDTLLHMLRNKNLLLYKGASTQVRGGGSENDPGQATVQQTNGGDGRFMAAESLGRMGKKARKDDVIKELKATAAEKDPRLKEESRKALGLIDK